jgi:integrase
MYRVGGRRTPARKITIGSFGKITVERAREEAVVILAKAELGDDVAAHRSRLRSEMTISQLCDEYLIEGVDKKRPSTINTDRSRIERHIKPLLGKKRISEVSRSDVVKFLRDVAIGKTARDVKTGKQGRSIVTGGKGAATRTVRLLGGIFSYAVAAGYLVNNPRSGVPVYKDNSNERFLSNDEFHVLGNTLRLAESEGLPWALNIDTRSKHWPKNPENRRETLPPHVTGAIRLLMFTGCRLREILHLKWNDVDLQRGLMNIRISKTGRKTVLLAAPAMAVLRSLPKVGEYVIAGKTANKPRSDLQRPWKRITQYAKLDGVRLHDLRHSFASVGAASGMGLPAIGRLLGHKSPTTTQRYAHFADDPLRRATELIADSIALAIGEKQLTKKDYQKTSAASLDCDLVD